MQEEEKEITFPLPQGRQQLAATFSLTKKLIQNNLHATFFECLSERKVRERKKNWKLERRKNIEGWLGQQKKGRKTERKRRRKSLKPSLKFV